MKQLLLLRHAKAAAHDYGDGDHERPLTERGRNDAGRMGAALARLGYHPGLIMCSSAVRTVQTLELIRPHFLQPVEACVETDLYHASDSEIALHVGNLPSTLSSVMFIGHNPGLEDLVMRLGQQHLAPGATAEKFPTCAFAAFSSNAASWHDALSGQWALQTLLRPADL